MDVLVLGTGALGSALAGCLGRATLVTVAGTWGEALRAIGRDGIAVEEDGARWSARVSVAPLGDLPPAEVVLVAVKSHRTASVAEAAARAAGRGVVVSLQNGLGHQRTLAEAAGPHRVAYGVTTLGATLLGPGVVRLLPGETVLGAPSPPAALAVARLAALLRAAGLPSRVVADIAPAQWRTLAVHCAINPLTALRGVANGALLEDDRAREAMTAAAHEVWRVAQACGVPLPEDPAADALAVARATAADRSSMLRDLDRGAPTEIDATCGYVVGEGRRLGVPTPVNQALWERVTALGRREPCGR